jgi:hypothetical protein
MLLSSDRGSVYDESRQSPGNIFRPFSLEKNYLSSSRLLNLVHHIVFGSLERRVLRRPVDIIFPFLNHFSVLAIFLADLVEQLTLLVVFVLAFCNPEKVSYRLM